MTDVTSFETTKKLLDAGFPESKDWGQQYYLEESKGSKTQFAHGIGGIVLGNGDSKTIRASSATDILKVLGSRYHLCYDNSEHHWVCKDRLKIDETRNENPAEAVAEMYLKVNSK